MTDKELMQQALEALERCVSSCFDQRAHEEVMSRPEHFVNQNITALRERLAQPEQEPVAWNLRYNRYPREGDLLADIHLLRWQEALPQSLNTPPRREWVGLTEEEVDECYYWKGRQWTTDELVRHVEAKLKEKNA